MWDRGLPRKNSSMYKIMYPPSKPGIGNKYIKPKFIESNDIKNTILKKPWDNASPEIFAMPIGPAISFLPALRLISV